MPSITGRLKQTIARARVGVRREQRKRESDKTRKLTLKRNKALKDTAESLARAADIEADRQIQIQLEAAKETEKTAKGKARAAKAERRKKSLQSLTEGLTELTASFSTKKKKKSTGKTRAKKATPKKPRKQGTSGTVTRMKN